jgi:hypothetical protein
MLYPSLDTQLTEIVVDVDFHHDDQGNWMVKSGEMTDPSVLR